MKRAFTLTELLIVISVIVVLAGVAIPVIGIVRRQAKDVQCRNNLQQIFTGITGYRMEYQQVFPAKLSDLMVKDSSLEGESTKLLWCPRDEHRVADGYFGRNADWTANQPLSLPRDTSYLFELANFLIGPAEENVWHWPAGGTWMGIKITEKRTGNNGGAFPDERFPILRCFHHYAWANASYNDTAEKVVNLSWDGRVFLSPPDWNAP